MNPKILVNPEVLSQSFVADKLRHRDKESAQLSNALGLVNTFVHGPIGCGKTVLLKHVIKNHNATHKEKAIYLDCSLYQTTNAIFHEILAALNRIVVSKSNYELTKRLKARLRHRSIDYPYNMHRLWKGFLDEVGLNVKAGTYQAFGTYIHLLRRLGRSLNIRVDQFYEGISRVFQPYLSLGRLPSHLSL